MGGAWEEQLRVMTVTKVGGWWVVGAPGCAASGRRTYDGYEGGRVVGGGAQWTPTKDRR